MAGGRRPKLWRLGAAASALLLLLLPGTALAHANLVRADPQPNAGVDQAPRQVQLWFSERPEPKLSDIQVFDQQRRRVDGGLAAQSPTDPESLVQSLQPDLPQGTYTVSWRTTSAVDGHVTGGAFAFGIGVKPTGADSQATLPVPQTAGSPLSYAIRWLGYLATTGLLGLLLFGALVLEPSQVNWNRASLGEALAVRFTRSGRVLAVLLVVAMLDMLLDQAARSAGDLSAGGLVTVLDTSVGQNLAARLGLSVVILALLLVSDRALVPMLGARHRSLGAAAAQAMRLETIPADVERFLVTGLLLIIMLLFALGSHAGAVESAPELALFVDWLHLTAAGIWVGGLIALAVGVMPVLGSRLRPKADLRKDDVELNQLLGPLVTGFSRVALISVAVIACTGFYQAVVHVGSLDAALSTDYGQALVIKTGIFVVTLLLAGFHRWWLIPALQQPSKVAATRARRFISRTLPLEALLVIAVLAATGVLANLPPANVQGNGAIQTQTMGDVRVTLQVAPMQPGPNLFQVNLRAHGQPAANADKVELQLTMLDMDMGQSVIDLQSQGGGVYSAQADALSMSGRWRADLLVRLPGQLDQRTSFDLVTKQ